MGKFNTDKKSKNDSADQFNRLVHGAEIVGDLTTSSSIRIDGSIQGNLHCKGKLVLGNEGSIKGQVFCDEAEIEGSITGDLDIENTLFLRASCAIEGNISTSKLIIENGAKFNGNCKMKSESNEKRNHFKSEDPSHEENKSDLVY